MSFFSGSGRCIRCGSRCEVYFCDDCGMDSSYGSLQIADQYRYAPTATRLGRALRSRVDIGAAYEQHMECQVAGNHSRTRRMLNEHSHAGLTADDHRAIRENGEPSVMRNHFGKPIELLLSKRRESRKSRRWWDSFARSWNEIGWVALEDATRPAVA